MLLVVWLLVVPGCAGGSGRSPGEGGQGASEGPGDYEWRLSHGGRGRFYQVHVPPGFQSGRPAPVVLVFHGGGGYPEAMRKQTGMDATADRAGFIVVYPAGTGARARRVLTFNAGICCGYAVERDVDDVGFVAAVIDDLARRLSIDRKRVYATGLSNGAMLSYRLACELSDRVAAVASVAGTLGIHRCPATRAVPVMHFHGLADQNSPYQGGVGARSVSRVNFTSVPQTIDFWRRHNGCPEAAETVLKGEATLKRWTPCRSGSEVALWSIEGGGHTWPGGETTLLEKPIVGPVNRDISASDEMWAFFARHRLP
jgi:polyhydroxybutyrate depolymerase